MRRENLELAADWLLPPRFQTLARDLCRSFNGRRHADPEVVASAAENVQLRGQLHGRRVFILCTGPSIQEEQLLPLAGEHCIAVSFFSLHPDYRAIAPEYHLLAPMHPPLDGEAAAKMLRAFKAVEGARSTLVMGHMRYENSYLDAMRRDPSLRPARLRCINNDGSPSLEERNYLEERVWDLTGRPFLMRSVLYGALQLALWLDAAEIYILGADQDYLKQFNAASTHFYEERSGVSDGEVHRNSTILKQLDDLRGAWHGYELIRRYAETRGCRIVNLSGGMLEIFPRNKLHEIL